MTAITLTAQDLPLFWRPTATTGWPLLPPPADLEPPTETLAWWRWLSASGSVERFEERLKRSLSSGESPALTVWVERSLTPVPERWVHHAVSGGERLELVQRDWFESRPEHPNGTMLLLDEYHHLVMGASGRGKSQAMVTMLARHFKAAGKSSPPVVLVTQHLSDFKNPLYRFTEEDLLPRSEAVPLDSMLLWCDRLDLLETLVQATGGWTHLRRQDALAGLRFLLLPVDWARNVQRWAEQTTLRLEMDEEPAAAAPARKRL